MGNRGFPGKETPGNHEWPGVLAGEPPWPQGVVEIFYYIPLGFTSVPQKWLEPVFLLYVVKDTHMKMAYILRGFGGCLVRGINQ